MCSTDLSFRRVDVTDSLLQGVLQKARVGEWQTDHQIVQRDGALAAVQLLEPLSHVVQLLAELGEVSDLAAVHGWQERGRDTATRSSSKGKPPAGPHFLLAES